MEYQLVASRDVQREKKQSVRSTLCVNGLENVTTRFDEGGEVVVETTMKGHLVTRLNVE